MESTESGSTPYSSKKYYQPLTTFCLRKVHSATTKSFGGENQQCTTHGITTKHTSPNPTKKYDTHNLHQSQWDTNKKLTRPQKKMNPQTNMGHCMK